jgi:hypothetical protein
LKKIILFFLLLSLISCGESFKDLSEKTASSEYILPRYREELLKDLDYKNFYKISITLDRVAEQVAGVVNFRYFNKTTIDLEELIFQLPMNNAEKIAMTIQSVEEGGIPAEFSYSEDFSTMKVHLTGKISPGQTVSLKIDYSIDFTINPDYFPGFSRIDSRGFSLPHFYPSAAPIQKGVWLIETPLSGKNLLTSESAWYFVEIETDDDVVIVTTGIEVNSDIRDGKQKRSFSAGPVRDFFICGDESFIPSVTLSGETDIISYSSGDDSGSSADAARITSSATSLFNSRFGTLPFSEMKITALPMTSQVIGFPGIFTIDETLYKNPDRDLFELTIVRESAHQWFYSILGSNHLTDPWIDEGFTQYATWLYYRERYGSSTALPMLNSFIEQWDQVKRENIPLNKPVSFYEDEQYQAMIYGRAPLFLIEIGNAMGEQEFHRFIRKLFAEYSHTIIDTETFREELKGFTAEPLDFVFSRYFD